MTAPSLVAAARILPDMHARIGRMADVMRERSEGPEGACTFRHLTAAGFTPAEIDGYRDFAIARLDGGPSALDIVVPGRDEGRALVEAARAIGEVQDRANGWSRPVVVETQARAQSDG